MCTWRFQMERPIILIFALNIRTRGDNTRFSITIQFTTLDQYLILIIVVEYRRLYVFIWKWFRNSVTGYANGVFGRCGYNDDTVAPKHVTNLTKPNLFSFARFIDYAGRGHYVNFITLVLPSFIQTINTKFNVILCDSYAPYTVNKFSIPVNWNCTIFT